MRSSCWMFYVGVFIIQPLLLYCYFMPFSWVSVGGNGTPGTRVTFQSDAALSLSLSLFLIMRGMSWRCVFKRPQYLYFRFKRAVSCVLFDSLRWSRGIGNRYQKANNLASASVKENWKFMLSFYYQIFTCLYVQRYCIDVEDEIFFCL